MGRNRRRADSGLAGRRQFGEFPTARVIADHRRVSGLGTIQGPCGHRVAAPIPFRDRHGRHGGIVRLALPRAKQTVRRHGQDTPLVPVCPAAGPPSVAPRRECPGPQAVGRTIFRHAARRTGTTGGLPPSPGTAMTRSISPGGAPACLNPNGGSPRMWGHVLPLSDHGASTPISDWSGPARTFKPLRETTALPCRVRRAARHRASHTGRAPPHASGRGGVA